MDIKEIETRERERLEINLALADRGVKFVDIRRAYIDPVVEIGGGTLIYPDVYIEGDSRVGENCEISHGTVIRDSQVGDGTRIQSSTIIESSVGSGSAIGPYAYLRPGSRVGDDCRVGDFVEIKNSSLGNGSKASHLTYIGDCDVGERVNFGCGVILVNYDGSNKYRSRIGDDVFVGCNTNIVSPVDIDDGAYIAAGSTITRNVPAGALHISRAKEVIKENWAEKAGLYRRKEGKK